MILEFLKCHGGVAICPLVRSRPPKGERFQLLRVWCHSLRLLFRATFDTSRGDAVLRNWVGLEKASQGTIESARSQVDSLDDIEEMRVLLKNVISAHDTLKQRLEDKLTNMTNYMALSKKGQ